MNVAAIELFTATNVLLGTAAFSFSTYAAFLLWRAKRHVHARFSKQFGLAVTGMFAAEAVLLGGTMVFTVAAHFGLDTGWTEFTRSVIRTPMLLLAFLTSVHLVKVIRRMCGF